MIIFFGEGRVGNQLFQYAFIKTLEVKKQVILSFNFEELSLLLEPVDNILNIENKYLKFLIRKIALPALNILSNARLITSYKVNTLNQNGFSTESSGYCCKKGLLPISYVYPCYVQSESFFSNYAVENFKIKQNYVAQARNFLDSLPRNFEKVFVHIRRGDYVQFSIFGLKDVSLPISYYRNQIEWFEHNLSNPFFIFLTDDKKYVEYSFGDIQNKVISNNSLFVDFTIMTICEHGIVSNSSFSWWGARMMSKRKKVFAPKYWLGWKSEVEYQHGIHPTFAEIVKVK